MSFLNQELYNNIYLYNYMMMIVSLPIVIGLKNKHKTEGPIFKYIEFIFDISILIYIISIFLVDYNGISGFLTMVGIDISIVLAIAFISLKVNKKFLISSFVTLGIASGGYFYYLDVMTQRINATSKVLLSENGELLLDIKSHKMRKKIDNVLKKYDIKMRLAFKNINYKERTELDDYYILDIPKKHLDQINDIKKELTQTGAVDYIEENNVFKINPKKGKNKKLKNVDEYKMNDLDLDKLWAFDVLEINKTYNFIRKNKIKPKKQAVIAILDTGVDAKHEDLKANYKSTNRKYDVDTAKHGTHCAGIAGAVTNNKIGVASIFPSNNFIDITSITVLPDGYGTDDGVIAGIIEAADNKVDVISMSLGGPSNPAKQRAFQQAIAYANKAGVIVVVAAGNDNQNAKKTSPANVKGVITVSAIDNELNKAEFSNTVQDLKMGIAAPGVNIYSTTPNNEYESFNGTSMATPYVASLLGFMKSLKPDLTTKEAYDILVKTGRKTNDNDETGLLIQPYKVIKYMVKNY